MKSYWHKYRGVVLAIGITILLLGVLFAIKGIYPFGKQVFNVGDFDEAYVPVYYKLWDVLHGLSSPFFDWNLGAGLNCFGSLISNSLLSPTSWIICFSSRDFIPFFMSFIIIIKFLEITILSYIGIHKILPDIPESHKITGTIAYTFCGWTLVMFSNILYLDVFALFPLFVYSLKLLLEKGKWKLYFTILTICLLLNYYMSYMILFFIVGFTALSLLFLNIDRKKEKLIKVTFFTLLALATSSIAFLPSFYQSITSYRIAKSSTVLAYGEYLVYEKLVFILPVFIFLPLLIKRINTMPKQSKKFTVLLIVYLLIGIIVEPINKMWHTGSYWSWPMRYAFIPTFIIIINAINIKKQENKRNSLIENIVIILAIVCYGVVLFLLGSELTPYEISMKITESSQIVVLGILTCISVIVASIIVYSSKTKYKSILFGLLLFVNTCGFGYIYVYDKSVSTSLDTNHILKSFSKLDNRYNYLDYSNSQNINGPYIMKTPSIQNWIHIISEKQINHFKDLGYNINELIVMANGGTVFSDVILNNKYIFSHVELNPNFYNLLETHNGINLYELKFFVPSFFIVNGDVKEKYEANNHIINNQDFLYKSITDDSNRLFTVETITDKNEIYLDSHKIYYLFQDEKDNLEYSNDLIVTYSFIQNDRLNISFYAKESGKYKIKVKDKNKVVLYSISVDSLKHFVDGQNNGSELNINKGKKVLKINLDNPKKIMLPINYDESYIIRINGKRVDYDEFYNNFIVLDTPGGENIIEITYFPKFLKEGMIISLSSILFLLIIFFINKAKRILDVNPIKNTLFVISFLIFSFFFLKTYILVLF